MRNRFRTYFRRKLLSLLEIPSATEFEAQDQKLIEDWLKFSIAHPGFHKYMKARDRAFVQSMIGMPIETGEQRVKYYEYQGARLEIARLFSRAEAAKSRESKKARKDS